MDDTRTPPRADHPLGPRRSWDTFVTRAGGDFEILHTTQLEAFTLATPAIVDRSLIIRTQSAVYRIAEPSAR